MIGIIIYQVVGPDNSNDNSNNSGNNAWQSQVYSANQNSRALHQVSAEGGVVAVRAERGEPHARLDDFMGYFVDQVRGRRGLKSFTQLAEALSKLMPPQQYDN